MEFALVAPLEPSGNTEIFTYSVPKNLENILEIGNIVVVPFGKRNLQGVVLEFTEKKPVFPTKEILTREDFFTVLPHLLKLAIWISEYYCAPLYKTLNSMIPQVIKRETKKEDSTISTSLEISSPSKIILTTHQNKALEKIIKGLSLQSKDSPSKQSSGPFLLHGVTGSGKTEIYLRAIEKVLRSGCQAIVLVPEISLTPQTVNRFEEKFPGQVATIHSRLTPKQKALNFKDIQEGKKNIVIGSRSAIFAPIKNLGIIIMDEEHDHSYKQEQTPRYHAREVAIKLSELTNSIFVMGSATPTVETYYQALQKKSVLLELPQRIAKSDGDTTLPEIEIVDIALEYQAKNYSVFSEQLANAIKEALKNNEQIFLFLNRRGFSTYIICQDCGKSIKCPNCELPLIMHSPTIHNVKKKQDLENRLACHHCSYKIDPPEVCPNCESVNIKYQGTGTQKIEQEIKRLFPLARVMRMDKDAVSGRDFYENSYKKIQNHEVDIVVGTQMISIGFDLPKVSLVGVIVADTALNFPDFKTEEQTFQLLTQVAGRAGRPHSRNLSFLNNGAQGAGKVFVQTFTPENPAIKFTKNHDYKGFYEYEIVVRESFKNPPFSKYIRLVLRDNNDARAEKKSHELYDKICNFINLKQETGNRKLEIYEPSPCFLHKIRGYYRHQILIKIFDEKDPKVLELKKFLRSLSGNWQIDVDAVNML